MGWLTNIFKGSSHKISEEHYHSYHDDETSWEAGRALVGSSDFDREEIDRAIALSIAEEDETGKKVIDTDSKLEEDEQLAKALQQSFNVESPPRSPPHQYGSFFSPFPFLDPSRYRICSGCNSQIGHGKYLSCMGGVWHPDCFRCHSCDQPISELEYSLLDNQPYHKSCFMELHHPKCDVCKNFIPMNAAGQIEYRAHPFWLQKYCPSHEHDGTPRCCSCEKMEPVDARYLHLEDGRKLCLECLDSSIMDTHECQPLYLEIQDFYEGLNMKVEQQIPLLLVERQALNEALEEEKRVITTYPKLEDFACRKSKSLPWCRGGQESEAIEY